MFNTYVLARPDAGHTVRFVKNENNTFAWYSLNVGEPAEDLIGDNIEPITVTNLTCCLMDMGWGCKRS